MAIVHRIPVLSRVARLIDYAFGQLNSISARLDKIDGQIALMMNSQPLPTQTVNLSDVSVLVTSDEVNLEHGTGVLLNRLFGEGEKIVSIRVCDNFQGRQTFGEASFRLPGPGLTRLEIFSNVQHWLGATAVKRVLCVPFYPESLVAALAIKELFNVPLCTWVMDDKTLFSAGVPYDLMKELIDKSSLCLAISPEMRLAYQNRFRRKFWVLPPLAPADEILAHVTDDLPASPRSGIMIGNVWLQQWFESLRRTINGSGIPLEWYCNSGPEGPIGLKFNREELSREGIAVHFGLSEHELIEELRRRSFAIAPVGPKGVHDDQLSITRLSLPSRLPFITATSQTPIIVIGDPDSAAARFVKRFEIGTVCDYDSAAFSEAVQFVTDPERQKTMRVNAARIAAKFSAKGIGDWIWNSMASGVPCDLRFEELMPIGADELAYYEEPPAPAAIYQDFVPPYQALRRLKSRGFDPDFVIDVGASCGPWSHSISGLFPRARYLLIEPLASRYDKLAKDSFIYSHPNFELIEVALSNSPGKVALHVASDLYNSSIFPVPNLVKDVGTIEVPATTLDELGRTKNISGCGLIKIDVQHAEHLVIEGGLDFIAKHVDAFVIETTLLAGFEGTKGILEMIQLMDNIGFRYWDDVGEWRSPMDGTLEQKDILFVRKGELRRTETPQPLALESNDFGATWRRLKRLKEVKLALNQYPPRRLNLSYRPAPNGAHSLPRISVVTPSFNQGVYLERTLKSVLDQGYPNLEYVVQDGGSSDASRSILERYRTRLHHYESAPDAGQAQAINRGFAHTSGEIMGWLNSDDLLLPGALHFIGRFFARHPEVDAIYGHRVLIDSHDNEVGRWVLPPHKNYLLKWVDVVPQETLYWRRRVWDAAGGRIDESFDFAIDWDLLIRLERSGARFVRVNRFLGAFRVHPQQKTTARMADLGAKEIERIYRSLHGREITQEEMGSHLGSYMRQNLIYHAMYEISYEFSKRLPSWLQRRRGLVSESHANN